jgi:hypothetical protein
MKVSGFELEAIGAPSRPISVNFLFHHVHVCAQVRMCFFHSYSLFIPFVFLLMVTP